MSHQRENLIMMISKQYEAYLKSRTTEQLLKLEKELGDNYSSFGSIVHEEVKKFL